MDKIRVRAAYIKGYMGTYHQWVADYGTYRNGGILYVGPPPDARTAMRHAVAEAYRYGQSGNGSTIVREVK